MPTVRKWIPKAFAASHVLLPLATFAYSYARPDDWSSHNIFRVVLFGEAGILCVWAGLAARAWQQRLAGTLAGLARIIHDCGNKDASESV